MNRPRHSILQTEAIPRIQARQEEWSTGATVRTCADACQLPFSLPPLLSATINSLEHNDAMYIVEASFDFIIFPCSFTFPQELAGDGFPPIARSTVLPQGLESRL